MVYYHLMYDFGIFGLVSWDFVFSLPMQILERFAASLFIILAGFSSRLSSNNIKRGLVVIALGFVVAIVSGFAGEPIYFGVLHLLGSSMVIYGVFGKYFDKLPKYFIPSVCIPLFACTYYMYRNVYVAINWLFPIGLRSLNFITSDYFPLMPWFFMFLIGTWLAKMLLTGERKPWMDRRYPRAMVWLGQKSMIIYLAHQIILYPLAWLISRFAT